MAREMHFSIISYKIKKKQNKTNKIKQQKQTNTNPTPPFPFYEINTFLNHN
jgi:hypothetical protein